MASYKHNEHTAKCVLFVGMMNHFHKHPVSQNDVKYGAASLVLKHYLVHKQSLSFDEVMKAIETKAAYDNNPDKYTLVQWWYGFCINCSTSHTLSVPLRNPFVTACENCHLEKMDETSYTASHTPLCFTSYIDANTSKHFNPAVSIFNDLPLVLREEIMNYLLTKRG